MKKFRISTMLALIALIATTMGAIASNAGFSSSDMYNFASAVQVPETYSTLDRTNDAVTMTINTSELDGGAAYTVWWVIFNNPENCTHPIPGVSGCGEPDLLAFGGDPSVNSSALWASGHVIGKNGVGNFAGHLKAGEAPGEVLFGPGLTNVEGAEIHLVVRSHGQLIPGLVIEQIQTFVGGCSVNACENHQFAVHQP
jgi:hypothetical protein